MADDPWAKFDKPADASAPADPYAQFAKPAGAQPEVSANPPAFQQRLEQGQTAEKTFGEMLKSQTDPAKIENLKKSWEAMKAGFGDEDIGISQENIVKHPTWLPFQPLAQGLDLIPRSLNAINYGVAAFISNGLKQEGTLSDADADKLQRDLIVGGTGAMMEGGIGATRFPSYLNSHPIVDAGNGEHARLVTDPATGAMTSHVIGEFPPKPADFQNAATNIAPITAYHGSPYSFDAFSMEKIGTGEGAQSYGHGIYLAEHPAVAADYARRLATNKDLLRENNELTLQLANAAPEARPAIQSKLDAVQKEIAASKEGGNQYQVRVHANPDHFLDWDKQLSEQSQHVRDSLPLPPEWYGTKWRGDETGETIYATLHNLARADEMPKVGVTRILNEAGIPGIKYLDQNSRPTPTIPQPVLDSLKAMDNLGYPSAAEALKDIRKEAKAGRDWKDVWDGRQPQDAARAKIIDDYLAGPRGTVPEAQTRNMVMFNDKDIEITHRNGEPVQTPQQIVEKNLRYAWEQGGHHPAELSLDAENNPALKRDLSSAATPSLPLPPRPDPKFIQALDDTFNRLRGGHTADQSEFLNFLDKVPDTLKTAEVQQEWYKHAERDPTAEMSPAAGKAYNEYMVPLKQEELRLYEEISKSQLPVDEYNPGYMHRVVVGKAPAIDRLAGEGTDSNPIHNGPGLLARSTGSLKERKYFAAEDFKTGERHIVSVKDGELRSVGGETKFEYSSSEPLKRGDTFSVDGKSMILTDALTREIEAGTSVRYYKNALVNTIDNVMHLRAVSRALSTVEQLRASPEWGKYATSINGERPEGWISPKMPLFKNDVMDPKLAHVIDDFYGRQPVDGLQATLEKVNRFATGSMFWTPVPHALNAGSWWAIDRGFDWITPKGLKSLAVDGATAIREVVRQGPKYQQLLREGNSLLAGSVRNQDFFSKLAKRAGMEFEKNPEGFAEVAQSVGMKPVDLIRGMYNASSNALWSVSDMFMMQRVLELEKHGLSTRFAIEEAERYIPNYRVPPEILGSRSLQQIYTNPNLFQFSRYHYGVLKGYANVAKDLITGDAEQKVHSMGAIMVLGSLQLILWPAISAMLQAVTGEQNIKAPSAGPGKLAAPLIQKGVNATADLWPDWVLKYYHDDTPMLNQLANLMPLAPVLKGSIEAGVTNRYNFTGRNIAEPSDVREGNWGAVAGQEAEHAAQTLVEPYSAFNSIMKKGESPAMGLMERAFGLTNRTDDQEAAKERAFHYQDRAARKRQNKPQGPIERLLGG